MKAILSGKLRQSPFHTAGYFHFPCDIRGLKLGNLEPDCRIRDENPRSFSRTLRFVSLCTVFKPQGIEGRSSLFRSAVRIVGNLIRIYLHRYRKASRVPARRLNLRQDVDAGSHRLRGQEASCNLKPICLPVPFFLFHGSVPHRRKRLPAARQKSVLITEYNALLFPADRRPGRNCPIAGGSRRFLGIPIPRHGNDVFCTHGLQKQPCSHDDCRPFIPPDRSVSVRGVIPFRRIQGENGAVVENRLACLCIQLFHPQPDRIETVSEFSVCVSGKGTAAVLVLGAVRLLIFRLRHAPWNKHRRKLPVISRPDTGHGLYIVLPIQARRIFPAGFPAQKRDTGFQAAVFTDGLIMIIFRYRRISVRFVMAGRLIPVEAVSVNLKIPVAVMAVNNRSFRSFLVKADQVLCRQIVWQISRPVLVIRTFLLRRLPCAFRSILIAYRHRQFLRRVNGIVLIGKISPFRIPGLLFHKDIISVWKRLGNPIGV